MVRKLFLFFIMLLPILVEAAPRIATLDWTVAETLTALGAPPVLLGDKRSYNQWVAYPKQPQSVADLGLRFQANLEYAHRIKPDFFIQTPFYAGVSAQLTRIAPIKEVATASDKGITWAQTLASTRQIAEWADKKPQAEQWIVATIHQFAQQKQLIEKIKRPVAVVQFADARHVRIYGKTSLFQVVMDKLGVQNAYSGESNVWGFALVSLRELAKLPENTLILIVQPNPIGLEQSLNNSVLWQNLSVSQAKNHSYIAPVWAYGALPSMRRFANVVVHELREKQS